MRLLTTVVVYMVCQGFLFGHDVGKIAKQNACKKDAQLLFEQGQYELAIQKLSYLIDSLQVADDNVLLNLGHSYFKSNKYAEAAKVYEKSFVSANKNIKSVAAQQLGILAYAADQDKDKAITYFKESLRANPANEEARYNYELLLKLKNQEKDKNQPDNKNNKQDPQKQEQNQDKKEQGQNNNPSDNNQKQPNNSDKNTNNDNKQGEGDKNKQNASDKDKSQNKDKNQPDNNKGDKGDKKDGGDKTDKQQANAKPDKQGEQGESKNDQKPGKEDDNGMAQKEKEGGKREKDKLVANPEKLMQMGLTEQRAKALLDAIRTGEVQYVQQMKRETGKTKKSNKPDW